MVTLTLGVNVCKTKLVALNEIEDLPGNSAGHPVEDAEVVGGETGGAGSAILELLETFSGLRRASVLRRGRVTLRTRRPAVHFFGSARFQFPSPNHSEQYDLIIVIY